MNDIAIYGAGGFGRETVLMIQQINQVLEKWNIIGFYDDGLSIGSLIDNLPVLGGIQEVNVLDRPVHLIVAIADPLTRQSIVARIQSPYIKFPVLIHPQANVGSHTNCFGRGSIITSGCVFTTNIILGEFVIVNLSTTLGHDVFLEDYCTIMPGSNISGNVKIGKSTLVGTGAQILQNISIGKECKIGAGAVVTKSCDEQRTLIGIPARVKP